MFGCDKLSCLFFSSTVIMNDMTYGGIGCAYMPVGGLKPPLLVTQCVDDNETPADAPSAIAQAEGLVNNTDHLVNTSAQDSFTVAPSVTLKKSVDGMLPRAHTCFNQIVFPIYSSRDVMKERFDFALQNTGDSFLMS